MAISPGGAAVLWLADVESAVENTLSAARGVADAARQNVVGTKPSSNLVAFIDSVMTPQTSRLDTLLGQDVVAVLKPRQLAKLAVVSEHIAAALCGIESALALASHRSHPLATTLEGVRTSLVATKAAVQGRIATEQRRAGIGLPIEAIIAMLTATPEGKDGDLMRAAEKHLLHAGDMVTLMRQVVHEEAWEIGDRIHVRKPLPSTVFEQHVRDDWQSLLSASSGAGDQWAKAFAQLRAEYAAATRA